MPDEWVDTLDSNKRVCRRSIDRETYQPREKNPVELAVQEEWNKGEELLKRLATSGNVHSFMPEISGAIFCGHLVADMDSIAGAIGGATLYGGTPARASAINSETEFALDYWGVSLDTIKPVEEIIAQDPDRKVCLVDFQQTTQLNSAIKMDNIVGVIDHHALQSSTIITQKPIYVDIRPWGSMSTILAYEFANRGAYLPKGVAGLLLCAILSDTLNLRSPTTTDWDRKTLSMLVQYTGVEDVNLLATKQFKAKSQSLTEMSAYSLVNGDVKQFKFSDPVGTSIQVAYSVVETTDLAAMLVRVPELLLEMRTVKSELSAVEGKPAVDCLYMALVDIVNMRSYLLLLGDAERSMAEAAYGGPSVALSAEVQEQVGPSGTKCLYDLKTRVSRKADFVPPLSSAISAGWKKPLSRSKSELDVNPGSVELDYSKDPAGRLARADGTVS